ncbi:hypothetical protein COY87_05335 [Candidatus Roizmanbacteria bacterium CG_4_10_14_0_8_um_filter_33_9]|uniref:Uncharacterized protein n=1 Tax=Candidatus Roizmanbacteria bacterium CG_4_10_14_0_8_um_filter_33_9 TaxID=1974826 RepID=A0A2M7QGY6_9BACT|nr:MAG: hypothetical protein COY87_05335 [Candidatus Roizmanbacteria bacterium CG_4_10_14_0_8_um_filter_33_9]
MTKLYLLSKQIHNLLVVFISVTGVAMALTGTILKFPFITNLFPFINYQLVRQLHNQLSLIFTFAFMIMAATGIVMYIFPGLKRKKS